MLNVTVAVVAWVVFGLFSLAVIVVALAFARAEARQQREFDLRWGDLERYHDARMRGLTFDDATEQYMARKQAEYDAWIQEKL